MLTFARVGVFVKRRAVKSPERERILGKMRRHPIHNYAQALLMKMID